MKKKLIFISVIIAILLIGTAVAGVISRSKVKAALSDDEMCNCANRSLLTKTEDKVIVNQGQCAYIATCRNCDLFYYVDLANHVYAWEDSGNGADMGTHKQICQGCGHFSGVTQSCNYTDRYTYPGGYGEKFHDAYCICGQAISEACTYAYDSKTNTQHRRYCTNCDFENVENHSYNDNGVCACGASDGGGSSNCNHNGQYYYTNPETGKHQKICKDCDTTIGEVETCTKDDSTCTAVEGTGYHQYNCKYCTEIVPENCYDEIVDGVCDACGDILCAHPNRVGSYLANNWHNWICDDCGSNGQEECVDSNEDGKCEVCKNCNHTSWIPATCTEPETCKGCGETRGTKEGHDFGYCEDNNDNETHTNYCTNSDCGYSEPENHYDYNGDNKCDACSYQMSSGTTHTHTPKITYETSTTEHWKICSDTSCNAVIDGTRENHTEPNNENKCDTCGYQFSSGTTHTHTPKITYETSATEHWKVCSDTNCGEEIEGTRGTHEDENNDNECDICERALNGAIIPECLHVNKTWKSNETHHWQECSNTSCGKEIEGTRGTHADENNDNKCDTCERVLSSGTTPECKHTNQAWDRTETQHWKVCIDCGEKITGTEANHSYTNGKCECGRLQNANTCNHTNQAWGRTETKHWKVCVECGEKISGTEENHSYTNGKCECGRLQNANTCNHTNIVWDRTETEHWKVCVECGKEIQGTRKTHSYTNGKCECGKLQNADTCKHTNTAWGRTETEHWKVCIECGKEVTGTKEKHTYANGKCECGRLEDGKTCEHKNTEWKSNKDEHWKVCKDCGEEISGTREKHELTNEKCKDCGADKDLTTTGKDIPNTGSETVVIGIIGITAVMGMSIIGIKKYKGI